MFFCERGRHIKIIQNLLLLLAAAAAASPPSLVESFVASFVIFHLTFSPRLSTLKMQSKYTEKTFLLLLSPLLEVDFYFCLEISPDTSRNFFFIALSRRLLSLAIWRKKLGAKSTRKNFFRLRA